MSHSPTIHSPTHHRKGNSADALHHPARNTLIALGFGLATLLTAGQASAQSMVNIKGSTVNMRTQPTTASEIMWELKQGFPLKAVQKKGRWMKVVDFEGDHG